MLLHVLLFRPRADLDSAKKEALAASLDVARRDIPGIRRVSIGRRVTHGRGYEQGMPDFPYAAILEFDDVASLRAYLDHPSHADLGTRFMEALEAGVILDYEVTPSSRG